MPLVSRNRRAPALPNHRLLLVFILESKARVCVEAARLSNKTEGVISHIF